MFSSQYDEVYHYTGLSGLRGIWESQSLRATQYDSLNDSTEIIHFCSTLEEEIFKESQTILHTIKKKSPIRYRKILNSRTPDTACREHAAGFIESIFNTTFKGTEIMPPLTLPYITSFCTHSPGSYEYKNGLLSQWRGYGKSEDGIRGGFAIVFDSKGLEDLIKWEADRYDYAHIAIADVIYDDDTDKFNSESHNIIELAKDALERANAADQSAFQNFIVPYLRVCTRYKHRAFREEKEIRIAACPNLYPFLDSPDTDEEKILGRKLKRKLAATMDIYKNSLKKPYILLNAHGKLPIKRVIVGPTDDTSRNALEISKILSSEIEVSKSETPFINR